MIIFLSWLLTELINIKSTIVEDLDPNYRSWPGLAAFPGSDGSPGLSGDGITTARLLTLSAARTAAGGWSCFCCHLPIIPDIRR